MPRFELGDWHSNNIPNWELWLAHLKGQRDVAALEIGTCEGRSALWLLENVLTGPECFVACVDTWEGIDGAFAVAKENLAEQIRRIRCALFRSTSAAYLRRNMLAWDVIYIDGSHTAKDVLQDSVLAWPLLKPGGILIWDDYRWTAKDEAGVEEWDAPGPSIDLFLSAYRKELERLPESEKAINAGWQVAVRKVAKA